MKIENQVMRSEQEMGKIKIEMMAKEKHNNVKEREIYIHKSKAESRR